MRLLGLWSQRQRGWLREGVAWACSSGSERNTQAGETPPCGVTRESVRGWAVDLKSTCSCTTASSASWGDAEAVGTSPPPSIYWSLVTHCLGTSRLLQRWFFPSLTTSRSHETKSKVTQTEDKKILGSLTKEMIKKITLKQIRLHLVLKRTEKHFWYCLMVHIHSKKF